MSRRFPDSRGPDNSWCGIRLEIAMFHIKQILCPVDLSEFSRHGFDCAIAVARGCGADVTVLHVLPVAGAVPAVPYGTEGPGPFGFDALDRERAVADLRRFLAAEQSVGVPVHYVAVESHSVQQEILLQISRQSADLVVMGTHGRSGFNRLFLGSVAEKTLRSSPVPVLVVPPRLPDVVSSGRDPFRSIVCAVDFSEDSKEAMGYAGSLAEHAGGRLILLHAVESMPVGYDPMVGISYDIVGHMQALERMARTELQEFVQPLSPACAMEAVVTTGKAYREILRLAEERQADLIVLGVHGRNALDRLVFGSTAEHVVRRATCPVLAVRGPGVK
jgi:nucleotide-binding universal stress UspA family protein